MNSTILYRMLATALALSLSLPLYAASPKLVLTARENGLESDQEFSCTGTIHGYLTLPEKAVNQHVLDGRWILPNGKVAQETRVVLNFPSPGRRTAYLWLAFEPPSSGLLGGLHPEQDAERLSFNGRWQVEIRWDEKPLLQQNFNVKCS